MGRRLSLLLVVLGLLVGAAATVNVSEPQAAGCPAGAKRAVIGGKVKCLRAGQKCAARYRAAYKKHGFTCVNGRLRKRVTVPPSQPPSQPPSPPAPPAPPAQPGHYKGTTSQNEVIEFDVSSDGSRVLGLLTGQINEGCNPPAHLSGGNLHGGNAPIAADGTFKFDFDYTSSVAGDPSKGHFTLTGKFSGTSWTGTLEDKVSFTHAGTAYSCGSGTQTWNATRAS